MTDARDSARPALSLLPDELAALLSIPGMEIRDGADSRQVVPLADGGMSGNGDVLRSVPAVSEPLGASCLPARPTTSRQVSHFETRRDALVREIVRESRRAAGLRGAPSRSARVGRIAIPALALGLVAVGLALGHRSGAAPGAGPVPASAAPAAAWSAIPGPMTPAQSASAVKVCDAYLNPLQTPVRSARLVLAERRGAYTGVVITVNGSSLGWCLFPTDNPSGPSFGVATPEPFTAGREVSQYDYAAFTGDVVLGGFGVSASPGGSNRDASSVVLGRVAPNVAKAVVETADGRGVQASVADGWYFAWWPWIAEPRSVTVYSASDAVLQTVEPEHYPEPGMSPDVPVVPRVSGNVGGHGGSVAPS